MVLQLTALIPSLASALQYPTSVTAFTFSLSHSIKLCWNLSLLRLKQGTWLTRGHFDTWVPNLSPPNPNPCPGQPLPLHSRKKLITQLYGSGNLWFTTAEMKHPCSSWTMYHLWRMCFSTHAPDWGKVEGITMPRTPLCQPSSALLLRVTTASCLHEIHPPSTFPQV